MPRKTISETYTRRQVSNIVKNIFIHLRKNMEDFTSDYGDYYNAVFEKDLEKIEKQWIKKYFDKFERNCMKYD